MSSPETAAAPPADVVALLDRLKFKRVGVEGGVITYGMTAAESDVSSREHAGHITISLRAHAPDTAARDDSLYELEMIATRADNLSTRVTIFSQNERFIPERLLKGNLEQLQRQLVDAGERWLSAA